MRTPFVSMEEIKHYLSGDDIECLVCGREFGTLQNHLAVHEMSVNEYREKFGIPWTVGLCGTKTRLKKAASTKRLLEAGYLWRGMRPGLRLGKSNSSRPRCAAIRAAILATGAHKLVSNTCADCGSDYLIQASVKPRSTRCPGCSRAHQRNRPHRKIN
jgi:hypothetical protein